MLCEEDAIDIQAVKQRVKEIIHETTNIPIEKIGDTTHFKKDLELDSLTLLEIGVNLDMEFDLDLPEEEMADFYNVQVSAEKVMACLAEKSA